MRALAMAILLGVGGGAPAMASAQEVRVVHGEVSARGSLFSELRTAGDDGAGGGGSAGVLFTPLPWISVALRWRFERFAVYHIGDVCTAFCPPGRGGSSIDTMITGPELAAGVQLPLSVGTVSPFVRGVLGLDLLPTCGGPSCGGLGMWTGGEVGAIWTLDTNLALVAGIELLGFFAAFLDPGLIASVFLGAHIG